MACILPCSSAVSVHDSQAYRKMDMTRERIRRILEQREILLSFQMGFNLVNAAVEEDSISGFIIGFFDDLDEVGADVVLLHGCPQSCMPNPVEGLLEVYENPEPATY